jgi:hypothetical protein
MLGEDYRTFQREVLEINFYRNSIIMTLEIFSNTTMRKGSPKTMVRLYLAKDRVTLPQKWRSHYAHIRPRIVSVFVNTRIPNRRFTPFAVPSSTGQVMSNWLIW